LFEDWGTKPQRLNTNRTPIEKSIVRESWKRFARQSERDHEI